MTGRFNGSIQPTAALDIVNVAADQMSKNESFQPAATLVIVNAAAD
jgi:hypothetical protein